MTRKALLMIGILMFSSLIPFVSGNAAIIDNIEFRVQGSGEEVPGQGYWVYGEFRNTGFVSKREVVVEVTLKDDQGAVLDVLTARVRPTIIDPKAKAGFLVKSTTTESVAEVKFRVVSYKETRNTNFLYLELSDIMPRDTGLSAVLSNTHENIYVFEAEVIASFYDAEGNIVDIQSYGANDYGQFDAGTRQAFLIETSSEFDSYTLLVQCNMASRVPYVRMEVEREGVFSSVVGEPIILILKDDPHRSIEYMDVFITDPNGDSATQQFYLGGLGDYRYGLTPVIAGTWKVTGVMEPYLVNNSLVLIEAGWFDTGFLVWDPDADTGSSGETPDTDDASQENGTTVVEEIDEAASTAVELLDKLPDSMREGIPGFPWASVIVALVVVLILLPRKN
jgi:hypothetical protein